MMKIDMKIEKPTAKEWPRFLARISLTFLITGPLYYFLVWPRIRGSIAGWIFTITLAIVLILLLVLIKTWNIEGLKSARRSMVLLLIIFGPIASSAFLPLGFRVFVFKVFIVIFFSILPGWLYLQFISAKSRTIGDEYILNLFRLHVDHYANLPKPPKQSIFFERWRNAQLRINKNNPKGGDVNRTIYEKKFYTQYGHYPSESGLTFETVRVENLWPVVIATIIISVGWTMVVDIESLWSSAGISTNDILNATTSSNEVSETTISTTLLLPPMDMFCFAFLGAYFYVIQMLVRRYFQNDLKTDAYISAIMRIIIVILLVWIIDLLMIKEPDSRVTQHAALAFAIGVFPYLGWQFLQAIIKSVFQIAIPTLKQKRPLENLDGLSIWYESRLLEEGIEDMENLATVNLVDVILNTRIPVDRLIDWVDQSLLYLHLGEYKDEGGKEAYSKLHRLGIRTATDLDDVFKSGDKKLISRIEYQLNDKKNEPSILRCIHATFKDEPNLYHVREWKGFADWELKPETKAVRYREAILRKGQKAVKHKKSIVHKGQKAVTNKEAIIAT